MKTAIRKSSARSPVAAKAGPRRAIAHANACELAAAGSYLLHLNVWRDEAGAQQIRDQLALACLANNAGLQVQVQAQVRGDWLDITAKSCDEELDINLHGTRIGEAGACTYETRPGIVCTGTTAPAKEIYDRWIADGLTPIFAAANRSKDAVLHGRSVSC